MAGANIKVIEIVERDAVGEPILGFHLEKHVPEAFRRRINAPGFDLDRPGALGPVTPLGDIVEVRSPVGDEALLRRRSCLGSRSACRRLHQ